jgi:hypothetical protein
MKRWLIIATLDLSEADLTEQWLRSVSLLSASVPTVALSRASRCLPDSQGAGNVVWDLIVDDDQPLGGIPTLSHFLEANQAPVLSSEAVPLTAIESGVDRFDGPRVKRTLLISVRPDTPAASVAGLEASLAGMPRHIDSIRSWVLSRVDSTRSSSLWTHAWEQEFVDASAFGPYMSHPYHWTGVERWFDPEIPQSIVESLAHFMCPASDPILNMGQAGPSR